MSISSGWMVAQDPCKKFLQSFQALVRIWATSMRRWTSSTRRSSLSCIVNVVFLQPSLDQITSVVLLCFTFFGPLSENHQLLSKWNKVLLWQNFLQRLSISFDIEQIVFLLFKLRALRGSRFYLARLSLKREFWSNSWLETLTRDNWKKTAVHTCCNFSKKTVQVINRVVLE